MGITKVMIELESTTIAYGAPLDRLFGEPGEVFVVGIAGSFDAADAIPPMVDDPLVMLGALLDDFFPFETVATGAPVVHDTVTFDAQVAPSPQDSWSWDLGDTDWLYGPHG